MAKESPGVITRSDLPVVEDWVLVAEAAVIAEVSRQYIHQRLDQFDAHQLSGYVALRRSEVIEFAKQRKLALKAAEKQRKAAEKAATQKSTAKKRALAKA